MLLISETDRQIVPAAWVDASFVPRGRSNWSEQLYGYGWWMREMAGRQVYDAWGYGGQFIFIVPDLELVVVTTSVATPGDERHDHLRALYDLVERLVIGPIASANQASLGGAAASDEATAPVGREKTFGPPPSCRCLGGCSAGRAAGAPQ